MTATSLTRVPGRLAWFGLLAPPVAWATQLVTGYSFEEAGCGRPDSSLWGSGIGSLTAIVVVACGAVAVLGGAASFVAWRSRRDDDRGLGQFFAVAGMLGSGIFLLAIVLAGVGTAALKGCSAG